MKSDDGVTVRVWVTRAIAMIILLAETGAWADPLAPPGDLRLRHDLQLLSDSGAINVPLNTWPLALGDVHAAIASANRAVLSARQRDAYDRVRQHLSWELYAGELEVELAVAGAERPRLVRTFEGTPRSDGEISAGMSWLGDRLAINLSVSYAANPFDGDKFRPDGSYIGIAVGNWLVTAGWQERWWGASRDGSLILSTNARPAPGVAIQRNLSTPFQTKWLSWVGPWTLSTFLTELDDERTVNKTRLFGVRGSFRPPNTGLEIGISRTAQWCGDNRPCDVGTFADLLIGNDNRGVNIAPVDEPGNQLGGIDVRWALPRQIPAAFYMQWIGEDGRGGGGAIGAWMRQVGFEHWGSIGSLSHRTHFELSDSTCRQGGFGFSDSVSNCAYEHAIYTTGYRYKGRAIGHSADGDSLSYSVGSTLVQSAGHSWSISLRYIEINRDDGLNVRHTLSSTPNVLSDFQVSHERHTVFGRFYAGLGISRIKDNTSGASRSDVTGFVQWSSH